MKIRKGCGASREAGFLEEGRGEKCSSDVQYGRLDIEGRVVWSSRMCECRRSTSRLAGNAGHGGALCCWRCTERTLPEH